ncbi:hypothetical protein ACFOKI_02905 [Sphingomonas qilianensis]|uniref:Terminase small subunit protein n=1 Tax=Sphingomonas qilianensis TaxID=1736690 RepID=A0ABU9XVJ6_9SPHN
MTEDERATAQALICDRLIDGLSLREICRGDDVPSKKTVCQWLADDETFRLRYAVAREMQADALVDEILEISDDGTNDWTQRRGKDGEDVTALDAEHVQRSRLRVDSRKWIAARLAPKKYGDASLLKLGDPDGRKLEGMDNTQMAAWLASLAASINQSQGD